MFTDTKYFRGKGAVVMVSSGACSQITPQMTVYAATKVLYLNLNYKSMQKLSNTSNLPTLKNVLQAYLSFLIKLEELISAKNLKNLPLQILKSCIYFVNVPEYYIESLQKFISCNFMFSHFDKKKNDRITKLSNPVKIRNLQNLDLNQAVLNVSHLKCHSYVHTFDWLVHYSFCMYLFQSFLDYFARALDFEYRSKGIIVQSLMPFYVATKMTRFSHTLSNPGLLIPSAERYAESAVATLGYTSRTSGYWPHTVQVQ